MKAESKDIPLKNALYVRQQAGFREWLRILNFEPSSQRDMPKMLTGFLGFLEEYLDYLSHRPSKTHEGALSKNYIRKHLQVVRKFARYLSESGQESFEVKVRITGKATRIKSILTKEEVWKLMRPPPVPL